jgi:hypothetical protein
MAAIHEAIVKIKQEVGAVEKDGFNKAQGFKFRSIDGIYNSVHPLFAKYGVFTVPRVMNSEFSQHETQKGGTMFRARLLVEYDLVASDGSREKFGPIAGEGFDYGDKATSKALAMAHKYMLIQALQLQTEDSDPDSYSAPETRGRDREPEPRRDTKPTDEPPPANKDMSETRRKLSESLREYVAGDRAKAKHIVPFILPGQTSVSQLPDKQVRPFALGWWLYRLLAGKEERIKDWMTTNEVAWFDKLDDAGMDRLKKFCQYEEKKQQESGSTVSPETKDTNGDDPF